MSLLLRYGERAFPRRVPSRADQLMKRPMVGWVALGAVLVAAAVWFSATARDVRRAAPADARAPAPSESPATLAATAEDAPDALAPTAAPAAESQRESAT